MQNNILDYEIEQKRVEKEIWSSIDVKNLTVIDFEIGDVSTKKLIDLGAKVVAVDNDMEKLKNYNNLGIPLIKCDIVNPPFNNKISDLAVFYFTLHEIDPLMHEKIISSACTISSKIMIVEPSPNGCTAYQRYKKLWRDTMHSINRFEDYQPISYWKTLIENCGFKITVSNRIKQNKTVPFAVLEDIVQNTIKNWKKLSIENKYINKMNEFLKYAKKKGTKWSDLIVIVGE